MNFHCFGRNKDCPPSHICILNLKSKKVNAKCCGFTGGYVLAAEQDMSILVLVKVVDSFIPLDRTRLTVSCCFQSV